MPPHPKILSILSLFSNTIKWNEATFISRVARETRKSIEPRMPTYVLLSIASRIIYSTCAIERNPGHDFAGLTAVISCLEDLTVPGCIVSFEVSD